MKLNIEEQKHPVVKSELLQLLVLLSLIVYKIHYLEIYIPPHFHYINTNISELWLFIRNISFILQIAVIISKIVLGVSIEYIGS